MITYPDFAESDPRRVFLMLAWEIGDRFSEEYQNVFRSLFREPIDNVAAALKVKMF